MNSNEFVATIPMPFTGESIVDGILVSWLVNPGETVKKGQNLAEIETEKSVWELESPCDGKIVELKAEPGDVVDVEAPLLEILTTDENMMHLQETKEKEKEKAGIVSETDRTEAVNHDSSNRLQISPRVKRMLRENDLTESELINIDGTGPDGRVTVEDVERFLNISVAKETLPINGTVHSYITGIGTYFPETVIDNKHFEEHFPDISGTYIEKVTGISERRWVDKESTSDMAVAAAVDALKEAKLDAKRLDMIILATTTPDMPLPATACAVQQQLGCTDIPAFDISAACSGWLYGLSIAQQFLKAGTYKNVLVIAAETMSKYTDKTDRATAFLFGDGAGAAVVSSEHKGHILSDIIMQADSSGYDIIYRKAGGSAMPPRKMDSPRDEYWYMDGGRMFRSAVESFSSVMEQVSSKSKLSLSDFQWFVPHQANERILKTVARKLKALPEKFFFNIKRFGNTSAASIPLALTDMQNQRMLRSGDRLLLCAVGAGLTSAGCVLTW